MLTERERMSAMEAALAAAGEDVSLISDLIGKPARVFTFPNRLDTFSFFAADAIFRDDGEFVLQEANGSNGATTGMLPDGQARRAHHMVQVALARGLEPSCVVLLPHANCTGLKPEFHLRQALFAEELAVAGVGDVKARTHLDDLGTEHVSVVIGPISALLASMEVKKECLYFKGRKVCFATNANLVAALERKPMGRQCGDGSGLDTRLFHEGKRGVEIVLNKSEQQRVAFGTGVRSLRHSEAPTWERAIDEVNTWHVEGLTPVGKISNGSQGVGIGFFPPDQDPPVEDELRRMRKKAQTSYGENADLTALPIRFFEFAASTRYRIGDGGHLWDIRVECHISPGCTTLIPCSMRICPAPFIVGKFNRDAVLSNLSGRGSGLEFVRTPFERHASGRTELEWAGIGESEFSAAMQAFANWCSAAIGEDV